MRIAVTGASGLIGSALCESLAAANIQVSKLVRRPVATATEIRWDPVQGVENLALLENLDAVVHLAGAGFGDKRWSSEYKKQIRDSRIQGTQTIARSLAALTDKPKVFISASAIGWYGDTGDSKVDETTASAAGFAPEVVRDWELAADAARDAGIRVVHPRTGLVMSTKGGALAKLVPLFKFGLGSPLGNGDQYWSFISLTDEIKAIRYLIEKTEISGPVNLTAPNPVTNHEVSKTLAKLLRRPMLPIGVPSLILKTALGEFSQEVLGSSRVIPAVLQRNGFGFEHTTIAQALKSALIK
ncbi:MAG: TIGR01777 family oxidoreductase [Actinobacteria bacterium]|nr:TIGR01777 family oxidoreductase [Actinomycetota bacterium]